MERVLHLSVNSWLFMTVASRRWSLISWHTDTHTHNNRHWERESSCTVCPKRPVSKFRFRDILIRFRIRGSAPLVYGSLSGSCSCLQWLSRCQQKIIFSPKLFFAYYLLHVHLRTKFGHWIQVRKRHYKRCRPQCITWYVCALKKTVNTTWLFQRQLLYCMVVFFTVLQFLPLPVHISFRKFLCILFFYGSGVSGSHGWGP